MSAEAYKLGSLDAVLGYGMTKDAGVGDILRDRVVRPVQRHVTEPAAGYLLKKFLGPLYINPVARMRDPAYSKAVANKAVDAMAMPFNAVASAAKDHTYGRQAFPTAANPGEASRQFREALQAQGLVKKGMLEKAAWGKAVMPILGALGGYAMAPQGEGAQGAMLGGLGALGLQSAVSGAGSPATPHVAAPTTAVAPSAGRSMQDVGRATLEEGKARALKWLHSVPAQKALPTPPLELEASGKRMAQQPPRAHTPTPGGRSWAQTREHQQGLEEQAARLKRREYVLDPPGMDRDTAAAMRQEFAAQGLNKRGSVEQFKLAIDVGGSVPIPGLGGLGVSFKDQRERLPGMSRWVPRSTMERGFDYADSGFDLETVLDNEANRGNLFHPAIGAALAAAGASKFAPKSGIGGALVAGLGGAGLGSLYHGATKDVRRREGLEALEGAQRERSKFPIQRAVSQTANEASPLAVSRGHGDA